MQLAIAGLCWVHAAGWACSEVPAFDASGLSCSDAHVVQIPNTSCDLLTTQRYALALLWSSVDMRCCCQDGVAGGNLTPLVTWPFSTLLNSG
ncbi:hypothetical protein COO60DRAFT_1531393 [Scenedesmus sp. NREL 46B-D3]|nr:hypothetical protein COO60DRAFT_1531393 [Scenedesmus sp. NREL 46B-D3]